MMQLHEILSVADGLDGTYIATADITDIEGTRSVVEYASVPGDTYGLAPMVRKAVEQWIADGKFIHPYVPPTAEELRATMPILERAQVLLALDAIDITEEMVDEKLAGDTQGMIEWKNRLRFRRDHYLIDSLGAAFGISPEEIDSLWLWAAEL